jgi:hypothetical protein
MKHFRITSILLIVILLLTACGSPSQSTAQPTLDANAVNTVVAQTLQAQVPPAAAPSGKLTSSNGVEFNIPVALGTGADSAIVPADNEQQMGSPTAYLEFTLQGYAPAREFLKPNIRVYSVQQLAANDQYTLERVRAMLANPVANPSPDPSIIPAGRSKVLSAAGLKPLSSGSVSGVRTLEILGSGQYPGETATSEGAVYQFMGLTADGQFYVVVMLPLSVSFLAQDSGSSVPADGVVLNMAQGTYDEAVYNAYLKQVSDRLNAAEADNTLSPSIPLMDALIQSIKVNSAGLILPTPMPSSAQELPTAQPPTSSCTDSAELMGEEPLDNAVFKPGEKITKRWDLKNTGTCTWVNYRFAFDGRSMGGNSTTAVDQVIPGQIIQLFAYPVAPAKEGTYEGGATLFNSAGGVVNVTYQGVAWPGVSIKIVTKGANNNVGGVTDAALTIVQEQGSGAICAAGSTYFVYFNITVNGATTVAYRVYVTDASGQVPNGAFDGYTPNVSDSLVFTGAGTQTITLHLLGPYTYPDSITIRGEVNGTNVSPVSVACH